MRRFQLKLTKRRRMSERVNGKQIIRAIKPTTCLLSIAETLITF